MTNLETLARYYAERNSHPADDDLLVRLHVAFLAGAQARQLEIDGTTSALIKQIQIAHKQIDDLVAALKKYADGTAFDFDRHTRGEVHFNMTLSMSVAREALKKHGSAKDG